MASPRRASRSTCLETERPRSFPTQVVPCYAPNADGAADSCYISKSFDATSHFETTSMDVLSLYKRITGTELRGNQPLREARPKYSRTALYPAASRLLLDETSSLGLSSTRVEEASSKHVCLKNVAASKL